MNNIFVYGTGGHGREISAIIGQIPNHKFIGFIDDQVSLNLESLTPDKAIEYSNKSKVIIAVGDPSLRRKLYLKCKDLNFQFATIIHPSSNIMSDLTIGEGSVVFPMCSLTVNVKIAEHVHINTACSISHDCTIEEFSTICPGTHICGNVHIGKNVFIGAGTTIINGNNDNKLIICDNTIIGAGACVTKSITEPGTYVGVPAKKTSIL